MMYKNTMDTTNETKWYKLSGVVVTNADIFLQDPSRKFIAQFKKITTYTTRKMSL